MASPHASIQPPDLPPAETLAIVADGALEARGLVREVRLTGGVQSGSSCPDLQFEEVIGERLRAGAANWPGVHLTDCRLVGCDFANANWTGARLTRVEFIDCRFTGWMASEAELSDVVFRDCKLADARLLHATLDRCRFEGCDLRRVSLEEASLHDIVARRCDLSEARLVRARTEHIDLRTCTLTAIQVAGEQLRGLTVEPGQCAALLHLLGAQVRSLEGDDR